MKNNAIELEQQYVDDSLKRGERRVLWLTMLAACLFLAYLVSLQNDYTARNKKKARSCNFRPVHIIINAISLIMQDKSTHSAASPQHLIAGLLPEDNSVEFFCVGNLKTHWIQNGQSHTWRELPIPLYAVCMNHYNKNEKARAVLGGIEEDGKPVSRDRQLEIYMSLGWGTPDGKPDMINGVLQEMENFRHSRDCMSLRFKQLKIEGKPLKPREIFMLDEMASPADPVDQTIAIAMKIRRSTFNQHSRALRDKAGVASKHALLMKATREGVVRNFNNAG